MSKIAQILPESKESPDFLAKSIRISPHLRTKENYEAFLLRLAVGQGDAEHRLPPLLVVHDGGRR